jgi:hypothetical protein
MTSFDNVKYGFDSSECCPDFAFTEPDGIKIAAPEQVTLPAAQQPSSKDAPLPLCLTVKFDGLYLSQFDHAYQAVKVVVVDDERSETFNGGVWQDRHFVPPGPSRLSPNALKARTFIEYNTVNLLEHIRLPRRAATYKIYALLEEHKSNVVTLRVDLE